MNLETTYKKIEMNLKKLKKLNVPELTISEIVKLIKNIKLLNKEDRKEYLYYLLDGVYDYDDNEEVNKLKNENVRNIFRNMDIKEIEDIQKEYSKK